MSREELEKIFEELPSPEEMETEKEYREAAQKAENRLRKEVLEKKPIPFEPPKDSTGSGAVGPHTTGNPLEYLSDKQKKIKEERAEELEQLKSRRHLCGEGVLVPFSFSEDVFEKWKCNRCGFVLQKKE